MKKSVSKFNGRQRILLTFLCVALLTGISFLINHNTRAEAESNGLQPVSRNNSLKSFKPQGKTAPAVKVGERVSAWLKLEPGKSLDTKFYGSDSAISSLQSNLAEPTSQASADVNADGYADLISGFRNAAGGGLIALHRANKEAFEPQNEQVLADLKRGIFPAAFEKDAIILDVPTVPDFIFAGKFSLDSAVDIVFASRGGRSIYLMTSDGKGGFNQPQEIAVNGEITALASQRLDYSGAYDGIVAAVSSGKSASLLVFSSNKDLMNTAPRVVPVESAVSSIILAKREASAATVKLFGLADGKLFTVSDIGGANGKVNTIDLPYRAVDFAVGNFIADSRVKNEIAVLAETGKVSYLTDGTLDTRPLTKEEISENLVKYGRRPLPVKPDNSPENWAEAESFQLGVYAVQNNPSALLRKAYLTGYETEDLMIVNGQTKHVEVLFKEPNRDENRSSFTGETKIQTIDFASTPEIILPMRLNVMRQQGFVAFGEGSLEPVMVMVAANATFNVSKTTDTNDGACNADCSLREAVRAANASAGPDTINIPNGTYQLAIAGINENAANTGDLDILDAVSIVGGGSATTFVQAGASAGTGIDKVFSVNPNLNLSFATSMSNLTIRFGNNTSDGFGGGMDWDAGSSGTITIDSTTATQNSMSIAAGLGGGGFLFTSATNQGGGSAAVTNSTISSNTATANGTASAIGGGINVGNTPFSMTNVIITGNNSKGAGGGLYIDPVSSGASGSSTFTNSTITNNTANPTTSGSDGGGIFTKRGLVLNAPVIISNNTATAFGGGISSVVINSSVNVNRATMVGNSATTNGGAIEVGMETNGNVFNMTFSRIVGNTGGGFNGLVSRGGTAIVENNWWGCNGGPNTAGCSTVGVVVPGTVGFTPWLRYTHTASPSSIVFGQNTTLTASFLTNSAGTAIAASNLDVLIGLPIAFNTPVRGTISAAQATIQSTGTATATFTGTSVGAGSANAAVDSGAATANITINKGNTTTGVTSSVNPSNVGQSVNFTATISVNSPASGTPTGTVQFVIDGSNFGAPVTVSGGTAVLTNVTSLTAGNHTVAANYSGDANFNASGGSLSGGQTVNAIPTVAAQAGVTRQKGTALSNSQIATVNDNDQSENTLAVTIRAVGAVAPGMGTATVNGVTVSNIAVSAAGVVTADVEASCLATTPATFTLRVTDTNGAFNETTLSVAVTANTLPTLTYSSPQTVQPGASLNVIPTATGDNGTVTYAIFSVTPALTTPPTVDTAGVVSITNANPPGDHTITVRATDNCEGVTDASFTLTVLQQQPIGLSIRDARVAEPASGQVDMLFTVALSAPAPAGGVTYQIDTADGGSANPATGGNCQSGNDYFTIGGGNRSFAAGEQVKVIGITVCSDSTASETDETFLVNVSNITGAQGSDTQATGTITPTSAPGRVLISEVRTSGPGGAGDDFIELYNNQDVSQDISGWAVAKSGSTCAATPVLVGVIPAATTLPPRGHYLIVGPQYSLAAAAAGNATVAAVTDIEADRNLGLFNTSDVLSFSTTAREDAVGFDTNDIDNCALLKEGANLPGASGSASEYSFVRKLTTGTPSDTNASATGFQIVSTTPAVAVGNNPTPALGAPGPENLAAPVQRNAVVKASLIDGTQAATAPPNRVRSSFGANPTNAAFGTLSIQRRFKNTLSVSVTRLRFRIVDLTTINNRTAQQADLRVLSSNGTVTNSQGNTVVTVTGLTLEAPPQPNGGGLNSTLTVIPPGGALAAGATLDVQFLLGVQEGGNFSFFVNVEALPVPPGAPGQLEGANLKNGASGKQQQ